MEHRLGGPNADVAIKKFLEMIMNGLTGFPDNRKTLEKI